MRSRWTLARRNAERIRRPGAALVVVAPVTRARVARRDAVGPAHPADTEFIGSAWLVALPAVHHVRLEIRTRATGTRLHASRTIERALTVGTYAACTTHAALATLGGVAVAVDADAIAAREPGPTHAATFAAELDVVVTRSVARVDALCGNAVPPWSARVVARSTVAWIVLKVVAHALADVAAAGALGPAGAGDARRSRRARDPAIATVVGIGEQILVRAVGAAGLSHRVLGEASAHAPRKRERDENGEPRSCAIRRRSRTAGG
jgi:hypothetical protein